ncbi:translation initiation factor IF-3 [Entomospira nematocerorum]|uniref:Translation initiation factor IF-3 n=1 Tax=Entomospira nematocerorum TaxID=2719987 RepID=A0A968KXN2_9SPIO|nr:translation initiation factor IF-3 [Entomospira nematocera]NIZ46697.1 translation initiation factor IF-3 [Entomospira nematocera]WDI33507.1 translation initiation factor IF-3 [Entomospira nematocera]
MAVKDVRMNEQIRVTTIRLVDEDGESEIVETKWALQKAIDLELDLVEIAPKANPPVCRILDYGKYCFEQDKKQREVKKHQKQSKLKEVRMQPKIDTHDMEFKTKHIRQFLSEGDKVKVSIRFRGREFAHTERGVDVLSEVLRILGEENYILEKPPLMEGRYMSMSLAPKSGKK